MPKATDTAAAPAASPSTPAGAANPPSSSSGSPAPAAVVRRPNPTEVFRQPPAVMRPARRPQPPVQKPAPKPPPCPPGEKRAVELHKAFRETPDWQFRATAARLRWAVGAELTEEQYDQAVSETVNARFGGM